MSPLLIVYKDGDGIGITYPQSANAEFWMLVLPVILKTASANGANLYEAGVEALNVRMLTPEATPAPMVLTAKGTG